MRPRWLDTGSSFTILSASPTCFLVLISLLLSRERMVEFSVNPDGSNLEALGAPVPFMTADCHCKGSEDEDRRLRWR